MGTKDPRVDAYIAKSGDFGDPQAPALDRREWMAEGKSRNWKYIRN